MPPLRGENRFPSQYLQGSPRSEPSQRAYQDGQDRGGSESKLLTFREHSENVSDIALRWSAKVGANLFYRYIAPLEQRDIFRDKDFFTPEA